jgi:hypothetical protein
MVRQLSELERKSIEPIALSVRDGKIRPRQRFISVVDDFVYGNSPEFIVAVESCVGTIYFVFIPTDTLWWLQKTNLKKIPPMNQNCFPMIIS